MQSKEEALRSNFVKTDVPVLNDNLTCVLDSLRVFFGRNSFLKLIFRSDYLAEEVLLALRDHSFASGEYQVCFVVVEIFF